MKKFMRCLPVFIISIFFTATAMPQDHDMNKMDSNKAGKKSIHDNRKPMKGGMKMDMMQMDKHFIEKMIQHHKAAIEMAKLALEKSKRPEIKEFARGIITNQSAEIENMKSLYMELFGTGVPVKPMKMKGKGKEMHGHEMMMMDMCMSKDMSGGSMDDLKKAQDFDKKFLKMMIKHHKMALMMSGMIADSKKPEMRKLGRDITVTRSDEIEKMIKWESDWDKTVETEK